MSKKKVQTALSEELPFADVFLNSPLYLWLSRCRRQLLAAAFISVALLFLMYKWSAYHSSRAGVAYSQVASDYSAFVHALEEGQSEDSGAYLAQLDEHLAACPSLRVDYDGLIAQQLLAYGAAAAEPYAARVLERTAANHLPEYQAFARASVAAAVGDSDEALHEAYALKATLLEEGSREQSLLFAYTLVRIAFLEQLVGSLKAAEAAWRQFQGYAGIVGGDTISSSPFNKEAFLAVANLFNEGNVSLVNYLNSQQWEQVDNS